MNEVKEEYVVSAIKPELVALVWPLVEDLLKKPIEHSNDELDIDGVFKSIVLGEMLLVTITKEAEVVAAIAIEQRTFTTGKKIMNLTLVGGVEMDGWIDTFEELTQRLAKDYGCSEIYIVGRKGWTRMLRRLGYETIHTVVSKKVGG